MIDKLPICRSAFPQFHGKGNVILQARRKRRHSHMTEEVRRHLRDEEIVEPVASLKIDEGRAFLSAIKDYLGL